MNESSTGMKELRRRAFLKACAAAGLCVTARPARAAEGAAAATAGGRRPNVILILADDLGVECIGAHGGTSYRTPALDALAAGGARFDYAYAQPLCTPTRVQLMTGQYNVRNYVAFGVMDPDLTTFAQLFKAAGYATCIAGKWQLGKDPGLPKRFGFDEACLWQHLRRPPRYVNPGLEVNGEEKDYANGEYGPDLVNDYARDFITRHRDGPFLLYYPMILTHDPYQPTPDSPDWDPKAVGESVNKDVKHFADMVAYMDKLIGKLVAHLDELGIRDHTLILFTGDNGTGYGAKSERNGRTVPGGKGRSIDSGIHVPLVVNWPAACPGGIVSDDLVDTTDFLPTICEAAGVDVPAGLTLDGRSFLPQVRGGKGDPRGWVYCWFSRGGGPKAQHEFALDRRFKLYANGRFYEWSADLAEERPLAEADLSPDAAAARAKLAGALAKYAAARPARIAEAGAGE
jgi:arylsulfatase A